MTPSDAPRSAPVRIRQATRADAAAVREIYAPFCASSVISFEIAVPTVLEMSERIGTITDRFPWLLLEEREEVAGYAYASAHHVRAAYSWSVDCAVYVDPRYQRRGIGRALYATLLDILHHQGYFKTFAAITLPNSASVALHESFGFEPVGIHRGVGYKFGSWHDVAHFQRALRPERQDPPTPQPVAACIDTTEWSTAVAAGLRHLRPAARGSA